MKRTSRQRKLHRVFQVGVVLKAIDGVLELAAGVLALFAGSITRLIERLAERELANGRNDALANAIERHIPYIAHHSQVFAAVYLLSHGAVKIVLAVGLLKNQLWAYPTALVVFILFIVYQVYRYTHTNSMSLLVLTAIDVIVVWLTWHEWRFVTRALNDGSSTG